MGQLLDGRVAVVTGGASGNGRAIARRFAAEGADVVVGDVRETPRTGGRPTHELVAAETDAQARFVRCDVTDPDEVDDLIDAAVDLGGPEVLVNNAGVLGEGQGFEEVDREEYRSVLDVNLYGTLLCSQAAVAPMRAAGGGSIVNLSSAAGLVGFDGYALYSAAKGAVRLLTYALAAELGPEGIRVNAIHPGVIETAMTKEDMPLVGTDAEAAVKENIPLGRLGTPEDVADAATYLASDLSGYVTAESLSVDGGELNTL